MIEIDKKYIHRLNTSVLPLKEKAAGVFVCRCPICGDSQKNQYKMRGHLVPNRELGIYWYYCHNCFANQPFSSFLRTVDAHLYSQFRLETFTSTFDPANYDIERKPTIEGQEYLDQLLEVYKLPSSHPAREYCERRKVPEAFYIPTFKSWAYQFAPEKVEKLDDSIKFIIFPLKTSYRIIGFQARLLSEKGPRFVTVSLHDSPLAYGLDKLQFNEMIYVVEGIFDSHHLKNCCATLNGNLSNAIKKLQLPEQNTVLCLDNERFNPHIVREYHKGVVNGNNIFIWPNDVQAKDFNELAVKYNYTNERIQDMVSSRTYRGAQAKLALSLWRNN